MDYYMYVKNRVLLGVFNCKMNRVILQPQHLSNEKTPHTSSPQLLLHQIH